MATLEEAHQVHPSARWWVKADGCDIVSGLEESLRNDWNGDIDLGTGEWQKMYQKYLDHLERIQSLECKGCLDCVAPRERRRSRRSKICR